MASKQHWPSIGQGQLVDELVSALDQHRLHSVIIFAGPHGVGKRAGARWLIQYDLCQASRAERPCQRCPSCLRLLNNQHPQCQIIEGANDTGISVDTVRALHQVGLVKLEPEEHRWILVENADQLTESAANAWLKFLEEPPPNVYVLMTTSQLELLPTTIRSRSAVYHWRLVSRVALTRYFATEAPTAGTQKIDQVVSRLAGRPATAKSLAAEEVSMQKEIGGLNIFFQDLQQHADTVGASFDEAELESYFALRELGLRELLLIAHHAWRRLLWPAQAANWQPIARAIGAQNILALLIRYQARYEYLHHHVQAKLLAHDLQME